MRRGAHDPRPPQPRRPRRGVRRSSRGGAVAPVRVGAARVASHLADALQGIARRWTDAGPGRDRSRIVAAGPLPDAGSLADGSGARALAREEADARALLDRAGALDAREVSPAG